MAATGRAIVFSVLALSLSGCGGFAAPPTGTPAPTATGTPTSTATPEPTLTLSPQPTRGWSEILSARRPTLEEINEDSIWVATSIDPKDIHAPGMLSYSAAIQKDRAYLFPAYWCATTPDVLHQDMQDISTQLIVNGEIVPDEFIFDYNYDTNTDWHCNYRSVILSGWKANTPYTLEVRRTLARPVFDGQSNYAAGEYVYRLVVSAP